MNNTKVKLTKNGYEVWIDDNRAFSGSIEAGFTLLAELMCKFGITSVASVRDNYDGTFRMEWGGATIHEIKERCEKLS